MKLKANRGMENTQNQHYVSRARGVRGRKGDVILELPDGRIALPRGFTPREWEWYDVEILEDRGRYVTVRLHSHVVGESGLCVKCGRVVDHDRLERFARRWLANLLNEGHIKNIKNMKTAVLSYFDELINDIDEMIKRLDREAQTHRASVNMCPGYSTDSCFADLCADEECLRLEAAIVYLERIRKGITERRQGANRALDYDIITTITEFGIERVFVPGI